MGLLFSGLEAGALALLLLGCVSTSREQRGVVPAALQISRKSIKEDCRGSRVVLYPQIATHGIVVHLRCGGVARHLEIVAHCISRTRRRAADQDGCSAVLVLQVPVHDGPANLVLGRTGRDVLDHQVAVYLARTDRKRAGSADLQISLHLAVVRKNETAAAHLQVPADTAGVQNQSAAQVKVCGWYIYIFIDTSKLLKPSVD
jgi:hypothetical protein